MKAEVSELLSHYELVYLEWVDSYGVSPVWEDTEDAEAVAHSCHSVGWIIKDTDNAIVIVPHLSPANDNLKITEQGCGDMTIPKCCIVTRKPIR